MADSAAVAVVTVCYSEAERKEEAVVTVNVEVTAGGVTGVLATADVGVDSKVGPSSSI